MLQVSESGAWLLTCRPTHPELDHVVLLEHLRHQTVVLPQAQVTVLRRDDAGRICTSIQPG